MEITCLCRLLICVQTMTFTSFFFQLISTDNGFPLKSGFKKRLSTQHDVKQPVSVRSRVCCRKAILSLLDQLINFEQRESLMIHASSGSRRMSAVSSAQSAEMLQSVFARWCCSKWFGIKSSKAGTHPTICGTKPCLILMIA